MKRSREKAYRLILLVVSVVFALYLLEVFLYISERDHGTSKAEQMAMEMGIPFDTRSTLELIRDLKRESKEAYPAIWPGSIIRTKGLGQGLPFHGERLLPLAGISGIPTILGNENGEYAIYQSDEHGFNNPSGLYQGGGVDMVLIGDSLSQGCCVKPGEDLGSLLREKECRVVNLGYGFNGPLLELATLMEYAKPMRPKWVLWLYFEGNDLLELTTEGQASQMLMKYLDEDFSQGLIERQEEIDQTLKGYYQTSLEQRKIERWRPKGGGALRRILTVSHLREKLGFGGLLPVAVDADLFKRILKKADDEVSSWGGRLVFVFLPSRERFLRGSRDGGFLHRDQVLSLVNHLNIPVIDVADAFNALSEPLSLFPFGIEPHYNWKGYEVVAETIEEHLQGACF